MGSKFVDMSDAPAIVGLTGVCEISLEASQQL